jgi:hypothetical protein
MRIEVYCDESRPELAAPPAAAHGEKKLLIGGLWIEGSVRRELKGAIRDLRDKHKVGAEFKWNRVSPSRLEFYRGVVDVFFQSPARFRCLVLPAAKLDADAYHDGDAELMFYKFYYQLLRHWIYPGNEYRIFVDEKRNRVRTRVHELGRVLHNASIGARIASTQALPSHEMDILQLVDVLTGVVGFHFTPGQSSAKLGLVARAEHYLGKKIGPTGREEGKFNVFCWQPGEW